MADAKKPAARQEPKAPSTSAPESRKPVGEPVAPPEPPSEQAVLDEAKAQWVTEALQQIRVASQNIRLYPEGSPQALRAAGSVFDPIAKLLEGRDSLTFGVKDEKFLVDGDLYKPADDHAAMATARFAKMLSDSSISSITFARETTVEELGAFLDGFSRRSWSQGNVQEVNRQLRERGVAHITLNEQVYVAVGEKDAVFVVERGEALLDKDGGAREKIMKTLAEMTKMVGEIQDEGVRDQTKLEIARKIVELDSALLPKLLEDGTIPKADGGGAETGEPIPRFSEENLTPVVTDFIALYREIERAVSEKRQIAGSVLTHMKSLVGSLLSLCRDQRGAMEKLLEGGKVDLVPSWLGEDLSEKLSTAASKAEELLKEDPFFMLRDDQQKTVDAMFRELDVEEQGEVISRLLSQIIQALRAPSPDVRLKAARRIGELQDVLNTINDRNLVKILDATVLAMMDSESNHRVYQESGVLLHSVLDRAIVEQDYKQAAHVVTVLRKHCVEAGKGFAARAEEARSILARLASPDTVRLLVVELLSEHKGARQAARDILIKFGDEGADALFNELEMTKDRAGRFAMADVIRAIGPSAVNRLMARIEREGSTDAAALLLDLVPQLGDEVEVLGRLGAMLRNPNPETRLAVLRTVHHMKGQKAAELAAAALRDRNPYVLAEAIRAAEEAPTEQGTGVLIELLCGDPGVTHDETIRIKEAICRALGAIRDARAVPHLIQLARKPSIVARLLRKCLPSGLRCAATRALAAFKQHPDANGALQSLRTDSDAQVRQTAEMCLQ